MAEYSAYTLRKAIHAPNCICHKYPIDEVNQVACKKAQRLYPHHKHPFVDVACQAQRQNILGDKGIDSARDLVERIVEDNPIDVHTAMRSASTIRFRRYFDRMEASVGFKDKDSCLAKVKEGEPIFVLRAQDKSAAMFVRMWSSMALQMGCPEEKVFEARALALKMDRWREANGGGKWPD